MIMEYCRDAHNNAAEWWAHLSLDAATRVYHEKFRSKRWFHLNSKHLNFSLDADGFPSIEFDGIKVQQPHARSLIVWICNCLIRLHYLALRLEKVIFTPFCTQSFYFISIYWDWPNDKVVCSNSTLCSVKETSDFMIFEGGEQEDESESREN